MCAASVPDALRTPLLCAPAAPAAEGVRALPAADRTGCCLPGPPQTGAPCPRGRTHSASVGPWLCPEVGCDLQDSVLRAPALRPPVSHPLFGHRHFPSLRCSLGAEMLFLSHHFLRLHLPVFLAVLTLFLGKLSAGAQGSQAQRFHPRPWALGLQ